MLLPRLGASLVRFIHPSTSRMGSYSATVSAATTLRRRLEDDTDIVVCPGVYDGLTARIALHVGFDALYMVCFSCPYTRIRLALYHSKY